MAQARKPKGIIDDIGKAITKALKAGKVDEVARLRGLQNTYMNDAAKMKAGTNELRRQWSNLAGRSIHAEKAAETATSKARRIREQGRVRGIEQKAQALGAKQQANPRAAAEKAFKQVEKRKAVRAAGGVNSPRKVQARRAKRGVK